MKRKTPEKKQCEVCGESVAKYKCPVCTLPYCSVACYKIHKEIPCSKPAEPSVSAPQVTPQSTTAKGEDRPTDLLTEEELRYLARSDALRTMLQDSHLRKCLSEIASCQVYDEKMKEAMGSPVFAAFANEVLTTVGARDEEGAFIM